MNKVGRIQKVIVLSGMVMVGVVASVFGQTEDSLANRLPRRFVHGLGVEARPEYVFPTHPFLRGENPERKLIRGAFSWEISLTGCFPENESFVALLDKKELIVKNIGIYSVIELKKKE